MKTAYIIAVVGLIVSNIALASDYACTLTEGAGGKEFESGFAIALDANGAGQHQLDRSSGGLTSGTFLVQQNQTLWRLLDPSTGKTVSATFPAGEGSFSRMQLLPGGNEDYVVTDCQRGAITDSALKPNGFACTLTEILNGVRTVAAFDVPVGISGHDIFPLPAGAIAPLAGWVLGYNGSFVMFLHNKELYHGITAVGSWEGPMALSWSPGPTDATGEVILSCHAR